MTFFSWLNKNKYIFFLKNFKNKINFYIINSDLIIDFLIKGSIKVGTVFHENVFTKSTGYNLIYIRRVSN